eukprot:7712347-Alexandrium_andersonii.AAC.1
MGVGLGMGVLWAVSAVGKCRARFGGRLRTPRAAAFVGRFGICMGKCAEHTPRELQGPMSRSFPGPRSSSSEGLKQFCMFQAPRTRQVQ